MGDEERRVSWRKETSWWDDLVVNPREIHRQPSPDGKKVSVGAWLAEQAPHALEHDYVLYTDGSGCMNGWGGYAAVIDKIDLTGEYREVVRSWPIVGGTYRSTVARSEMTAFLEGMTAILEDRCDDVMSSAVGDDEAKYLIGSSGGPLSQVSGEERIRVLWHTDRANTAASLLYDEEGEPVKSRDTDKDLWMRWSFMAKHFCVTPLAAPRNTVHKQKLCDKMAGLARAAMLEKAPDFARATEEFYDEKQWQKKLSQKARF